MSASNPPSPLSRAVFLDRDGVLIADVDHLTSVEQVRVLPRVPEALARLRATGWKLIIATNQTVVARGSITEERLREIHQVLLGQLRARGIEIDAVYYCPHHPDGAVPEYRQVCDCRKPNAGMLLRAAEEWHLDLGASVVVGDAPSDIEAGRRAGCWTVLIHDAEGRDTQRSSGLGSPAGDDSVRTSLTHRAEDPAIPDYVARDLWDAAGWILAISPREAR